MCKADSKEVTAESRSEESTTTSSEVVSSFQVIDVPLSGETHTSVSLCFNYIL